MCRYGLRSGLDLDSCPNDHDALTSYFSHMHSAQSDWQGAAWFGASETTSCSG